MDTGKIGLGHTAVLVNNGSSSGPFQWREVIEDPEPSCGNGYVTYYSGTTSWPGYYTYTFNTSGVAIASTFSYATEGQSLTITSSVGVGTTGTSTPAKYSIGYATTSPTNPSLTGCGGLDTAITSAESSRDSIISTNTTIVNDTLNKAKVLRRLRNKLETEAFSMLQGRVYAEVEKSTLESDITTLNNTDFTSYEPEKPNKNNKFSSNTTGVATS